MKQVLYWAGGVGGALVALLLIIGMVPSDPSGSSAGAAPAAAGATPWHEVVMSYEWWKIPVVFWVAALAALVLVGMTYKDDWKKALAYLGGIVVVLVIWGLYKNDQLHVGGRIYALYVVAGAVYLVMHKTLGDKSIFRKFYLWAAFGVLGISHLFSYSQLEAKAATLWGGDGDIRLAGGMPRSCVGVVGEPIKLDMNPIPVPPNCIIYSDVAVGVVEFIPRTSGESVTKRPGQSVTWPRGFEVRSVRAESGKAEVWMAFCPKDTPRLINNKCVS